MMTWRLRWCWPICLVAVVGAQSAGWSDEAPQQQTPSNQAPSTQPSAPSKRPGAPSIPAAARKLYQGKVVMVAEALKERGIKFSAEELKDQVALETARGELIPILPDWRGRAFYQDKRLRNRAVELIGFQRDGLPYLNVMSVYTFDEQGGRQYTDYWCDICSIPMYEIKPCDCCQQEIRLRFQRQEITELDLGKPATDQNVKQE